MTDTASPNGDGAGGADYYLVAHVEHPASYTYIAVASAVPVIVAEGAPKSEMLTATFTTLEAAEASRDELIAKLRARLAARGDRVVSVERDRPASLDPPPQ